MFSLSRAYQIAILAYLAVLPFHRACELQAHPAVPFYYLHAPYLVYHFTNLPFTALTVLAIVSSYYFTFRANSRPCRFLHFHHFTERAGLSFYHLLIYHFTRLTDSLFLPPRRFPALFV